MILSRYMGTVLAIAPEHFSDYMKSILLARRLIALANVE